MRKVWAVMLAVALAGVALAQGVQEAIAASGQAAIKAAIREVAPAVVKVEATRKVSTWWDQFFQDPFLRRFFGEPDTTQTSLGSGFVVEYAGRKYILTNYHVVENATSIVVTAQSGESWTAQVIGTDELLDLAVLAVDGIDLPAAPLGDSSALEIGDWVIAIGNPLGFSHTVTLGIVSALNRDVPKPDGSGYYRRMIQTDAAINPGNSGGPLVNAYGEVVGMNTIIARQTSSGIAVEGINFAVPINEIKLALTQIVEKGRVTRAWLGVYLQDVIPGMERQLGVREGALVTEVVANSPAAKAGIKSGDVIIAVDGERIKDSNDLQMAIMYRRPGERVSLTLVRDKRTMTVGVVLEERPAESAMAPSPSQGVVKFGLTVQDLTAELRSRYGITQSAGVVVVAVESGSRAYWGGVQVGDLIVEVNRQSVASTSDWNRIVSQLSEQDEVLLTVIRSGRTRFILLP
ncbi:MAG: Do family serine endopeptidase [Candidatus Bipolaricaulota bacterium]|nr:Do family serine endopeptidase [Candidatus Bipolaricaulota bacterium]MDW8126423.1 Do family serine endopeptidase [Candidatus Bipolaricaulota bacterium]